MAAGIAIVAALAVASGSAAGSGTGLNPHTAMQKLTMHRRAFLQMPAGAYHMTKFHPSYRFTLSKTTSAGIWLPTETSVNYGRDPLHATLVVAFWSGPLVLLDPAVAQTTVAGATADANAAAMSTPDGLLNWLTTHPRLDVSERKNVTIGAASGIEIQVRAKSGAPYASELCSSGPCVPLFLARPLSEVIRGHGAIGETADLASKNPVRMDILSVKGQLLLITTDVYKGSFARQSKAAREFLSTVEFD